MPIFLGTVSASLDDGREDGAGGTAWTSTYNQVKNNATPTSSNFIASLLRFTVNVPQGSTINYGSVMFHTSSVGGPYTFLGTIFAHDVDESGNLGSAAVISRTRTTAYNAINQSGMSYDTNYWFPCGSAIQEVIDRPGWNQNNHLSLLCIPTASAGGQTLFSSYDYGNSSQYPVIKIDYTEPGTPVTSGTITYYISAGLDDGHEYGNTTQYYTSTYCSVKNDTATNTTNFRFSFLRFLLNTVKNTNIVSATLRLRSATAFAPYTLMCRVYYDDVNDSVGLASATIASRTKSTSYTAVSQTGITAASDVDIDVTTLVQETVDKGGWSAGNHIGFILWPDTTGSGGEYLFMAYEHSTEPEAQLIIVYETNNPAFESDPAPGGVGSDLSGVIEPPSYWKTLFDAQWPTDYSTYFRPWSLTGNVYDVYFVGGPILATTRMYQVYRDTDYIDAAITLTQNMISVSRLSTAMPGSWNDNYYGWYNYSTNEEEQLREFFCWRHVAFMLYVIRTDPTLYNTSYYRNIFDTILAWTERNIWEKWWTRSNPTSLNWIYRLVMHMVGHAGNMSYYLSQVTNNLSKKAQYEQIYHSIMNGPITSDYPDLTSYREEVIPNPSDSNANWWDELLNEWSSVTDGSHAGAVVYFYVNMFENGIDVTQNEINRMIYTFRNYVWNGATPGRYYLWMDGSGGLLTSTGPQTWDGWIDLARLEPSGEIQQMFEGTPYYYSYYKSREYGIGCYNAYVMLQGEVVAGGTVVFPDTTVNTIGSANIDIHNAGSSNLIMSNYVISGDDAAFFAVSSPVGTLGPDEYGTVALTFSPTIIRDYSGTITFNTNDTAYGTVTYPMVGTGLKADPVLVPDVGYENIFNVYADWGRDSSFAQTVDNVSLYYTALDWTIGITTPYQQTADESRMNITFNNEDDRFSPENYDGPYGGSLTPNTPMRVYFQHPDIGTTIMWNGYLDDVIPQPGQYLGKLVTITGVGPKQLLQQKKIKSELLENYRSDEVIAYILDQLENPVINYNLQTGIETFSYVGDTWGESTNAYEAIKSVTEAEYGKFFFDRSGTAIFWNRNYLAGLSAVSGTVDNTMVSLTYKWADIYNVVSVTCTPRSVAGSSSLLWELTDPITIRANDTKTITCNFKDQNNGARISATDIIEPTIANGYLGFSSGSATLTTFTEKAISVELTFTNSSASECVIDTLEIRGNKLINWNTQTATVSDASSVSKYGERELSVNATLLDDFATAESIARYLLNIFKSPYGLVTSFTLKTTLTDPDLDKLDLMINKGIGSVITVIDDKLHHEGTYVVIGQKHSLEGGTGGKLYSVTFYVEPVSRDPFWIMGTGRLGIDTRLGI